MKKKVKIFKKVFNKESILNFLYILLIIASFLSVPYHNIRTGFTNWGLTGALGASGPVNAGALAVQRALTFALILFYIYSLRLKRKMKDENFEIDLAIKESENRRHLMEREYFKLRRQMQNIFDTMDDLVFICSKDFKIEFMNKALKNSFGECVGKKCFEVLYKRIEMCPWCFAKSVFEGEFVVLEHKHELNQKTYLIRSSPFINPDGSVSKISILHDITSEVKMKSELESSEQHFRNLFENLPVACFGYGKDAKIIIWNKAARKLYGFKDEEVIGHFMFDTIVQERDREKTMFYINEVFGGKYFDGLEWEDRNIDGSSRYVYTSTYPLFDSQGNVVMGISANIDITTQKASERELKGSKEHLEKIMETPQNLIIELDKDMNIKMFNKGCEEVTGFSRQEAIGRNWLELFVPERLRDAIRGIFEGLKNNSNLFPSQYESPMLTKSGEEKIVFWSYRNLNDDKGQLVSSIVIGQDITLRKRAQQKIVDSEEKYRTFLENVPVHVGVIDESGKFIVWNKYSETVLGYTKHEAIGKLSPKDIYESEEGARRVIETAAANGIFNEELNLVHKDGRKTPVRLVVVPRIVDNKVIGFTGFGEDISERKKAEGELLATKEKLESIALIDPLTELFNNRYIVDRLASEFERSKRSLDSLSLLLIDLDYFKSINDKYGHEFGDKVLMQVAKLLKTELRANDIVGRWGGEEFMIILPEVGRENAILVSKKLLQVFKLKGFGDETNIVNLKCSIGIVSYPEDPLFNPKEMFESVEKSVLKVKTSGGDGTGSYIFGLIKDDDKAFISEKDRLLDSLKKKMEFFSFKGEDSILEAIYSLSKSLELKDHTTRRHADKTIHFAIKLAKRFGMSEREVENVKRAAILHDIGKLGIPDKILLKKGPLTKAEYEVVKQHPKIAAEIISTAEFLKESVPYVFHHHERFDGTGYPDGLKGEVIPLGARIITVVDVYEALTSDRPYHKALSKEDAIREIQINAGIQFDPNIVREFLDLLKSESDL
jgi:diguanylate cyclase (GGDEF)-like protein/PAS domain S-box-containing protein